MIYHKKKKRLHVSSDYVSPNDRDIEKYEEQLEGLYRDYAEAQAQLDIPMMNNISALIAQKKAALCRMRNIEYKVPVL